MIIHPKIRGFICTTAHPDGCYQSVAQQIEYIQRQPHFQGPKNVLVIGASTGYGLASRIVSTFGGGANTIGVMYEKAADDKRTASAGWYNTAAFTELAQSHGYYAKTLNGDGFSHAMKQAVTQVIREELKQPIDLIIYSVAAPRRIHPDTGQVYNSTLKPIGATFTSKTVDAFRGEVKEVILEPATELEIADTVAVMGGADWSLWIDYLMKENLLAAGITTVAYSYLGPELTHAVYKGGTIGRAKEDLQATAHRLQQQLASTYQGRALISINKALVTQASSAIPVVPLYLSLLYRFMKSAGTHEGCIEQISRLFHQLYAEPVLALDEEGRLRLDDREMQAFIQQEIQELWPSVTTENLEQLTDIAGYREDFYKLFGFAFPQINYDQDINAERRIPGIVEIQSQ